ncbi:methylenetetrahydrofolate--tRNA-(uracil(54)-C(5))-methyltransferase (FADH(2)-oxidizing) TrmFO [Bacteriovoracaceae bacterium]|nr:methylenetetrahydrofolate--tRNA-(uracil(54)-C(5))-methyltransferase (FADH(2)-oxidizing) TrmFO [Bacteriovoracaceae bacterium]
METNKKVLIIGGGLAGVEAAHFLSQAGISVILVEGKTKKPNPAQKLSTLAELVCTNSLKSIKSTSAHGMLKFEMRKLGSLILEKAEESKVPAGDALSVDRIKFSESVTNFLKNKTNIELVEESVSDPIEMQKKYKADYVICATGPLTSEGLTNWFSSELDDSDGLYFYDAIAPIVELDGLDTSKMYFKDRFATPLGAEDEFKGDYLNVPFTKGQYEEFVKDLIEADKVQAHNFEDWNFFEACLPIDTMAERGVETLRFSCMKPVGLKTPEGEKPYAVLQLRKENLLGDAFNLVGFQNRLTYPEQKRVFKKIPGFEEAQFIHLGSVHRNTFLHSKRLLNKDLSSKKFPELFFAGQITGVEGYTESASIGLFVATQILNRIKGNEDILVYPIETCIGALINYLFTVPDPRPSSINFGLIPSIELPKGKKLKRFEKKLLKKEMAAERGNKIFSEFYQSKITKNLELE